MTDTSTAVVESADKYAANTIRLSGVIEQPPESPNDLFSQAQSWQGAGRLAEAADLYAKRADMGGVDEESWYSRVQQARCLRSVGDEQGFVRQALVAFNQRPDRAEPLYDLARYYRERCLYDVSVLFCEAGLALPPPSQGARFVEDFVYNAGLHEEYSIAANYARDRVRKQRGHAACNGLALKRDIPAATRNQARSNLFFYVEPAAQIMPSFKEVPVGFVAPDDYRAMNPSVARWGDCIVMIQRAVNYVLKEDGSYHTIDGSRFRTRNFLLSLDHDLNIGSSVEILPPTDLPKPMYWDENAFGDLRLFSWRDALWCVACYRELTPEGWCEQVLARIDCPPEGPGRLADWHVVRPGRPARHEKNWMPLIARDQVRLIYLCDPTRVVDDEGRTVAESIPSIAAEQFRGGSQSIPFDGGWLCLVHEVLWGSGRRFYLHRFVWFDASYTLQRVSRSFYFQKKSFEFAAGLAWHPDSTRLLISYGIDDGESWVATVDASELDPLLEHVRN